MQLRGFRFHMQTVKNIYVVGAPSIVMQAIGSVMTMGMNAILVAFGNTAVAFFRRLFQAAVLCLYAGLWTDAGVMPILGYNYGAQNKRRLLSALRICCIIAVVIMAIGLVIFQLFPGQLLSIFNASENMLAIGMPALATISLCFIPAALGISFSTLFQAVGSGIRAFWFPLLRQLILLLPCAFPAVQNQFGCRLVCVPLRGGFLLCGQPFDCVAHLQTSHQRYAGSEACSGKRLTPSSERDSSKAQNCFTAALPSADEARAETRSFVNRRLCPCSGREQMQNGPPAWNCGEGPFLRFLLSAGQRTRRTREGRSRCSRWAACGFPLPLCPSRSFKMASWLK